MRLRVGYVAGGHAFACTGSKTAQPPLPPEVRARGPGRWASPIATRAFSSHLPVVPPSSTVASARGLDFTEDESGNVMLDEEGKPTLNEAMSAEKRAYSRAVLTYTDAVALLQGSTSDSVETTRIASAAQRISKIDKS